MKSLKKLLAALCLIAMSSTLGMKEENLSYKFFKAIQDCDVATVKDILHKNPELADKKYNTSGLITIEQQHMMTNPDDTIDTENDVDDVLETPLDFIFHDVMTDWTEPKEVYNTETQQWEPESLLETNPFKDRKCALDLIQLFLKNPKVTVDDHIQGHFNYMINQILYAETPWSDETLQAFKIITSTRPNLIDVSKPLTQEQYYIDPSNPIQGPVFLEDIIIFPGNHDKILYPDLNADLVINYDDIFKRKNNTQAVQLILNHPTFDATKAAAEKWQPFIDTVIENEVLSLIPTIYKAFNNQAWFKKLPYYAVYKALSLMNDQKINKITAQAFLLIDDNNELQTLKQILLGDKNNQKQLKEKGLLQQRLQSLADINPQIFSALQQAYVYAKQNNLKKIGSYIRRYMTTLLNTPQDIGKVILAFEADDNPLVSTKKK